MNDLNNHTIFLITTMMVGNQIRQRRNFEQHHQILDCVGTLSNTEQAQCDAEIEADGSDPLLPNVDFCFLPSIEHSAAMLN